MNTHTDIYIYIYIMRDNFPVARVGVFQGLAVSMTRELVGPRNMSRDPVLGPENPISLN